MAEMASGFLTLAGGFGTLDEFFEIVTWRQLGHHERPIVLFNGSGYFDPLLAALKHVADEGFARDGAEYFAVETEPVAAVRRALDGGGAPSGGSMARTTLIAGGRALGLSAVAAFVLLAGTAEERTFGTVSDEQQMLYTAISIATTVELGIARGQTFSIPRPAGDAVSPYGMGLPLLEVPFALAAGPWEARFGARTSQTLFVLLQVLLVTAAAPGAGLLARTLGAGGFGQGARRLRDGPRLAPLGLHGVRIHGAAAGGLPRLRDDAARFAPPGRTAARRCGSPAPRGSRRAGSSSRRW